MKNLIQLNSFKDDLTGGVMGGIIGIPICMGYSVLAFAPLGEKYLPLGIVSFIASMIVMNIVTAFFSGVKILINGPNALVAVMLASVLSAGLKIAEGMPNQAQLALTLLFLVCLISGLIQTLSGVLKIGGLAKYIPLPVVAGLMNGTAVIIMSKQIRPLLGLKADAVLSNFDFLSKNAQMPTLAVGIITFATIVFGPKLLKSIPPAIMGIIVGTISYYGAKALVGAPHLGPVIGEIPSGIPKPEYIWNFMKLFGESDIIKSIPSLLPLAASLAVVATLLTLIAVVTADSMNGERSDSNRELMGQGIGNTIASLFGGTTNIGSVTAMVTSFTNGAQSATSKLICGVFMLGILLALGVFIALVPKVVLAGVLVFMAIKLLEPWSLSLFSDIFKRKISLKESAMDVGIIMTVLLILVFMGVIQAVFAGIIISLIYFVYRMTMDNVRREYGADKVHSNTMRNEEEFAILEQNGDKIKVLELEGALFFGTTDKLSCHIEHLLTEQDVKFIILDFARVSEIDSTGFNILMKASMNFKKRNVALAISAIRSKNKISVMVDTTNICGAIGKEYFFDSIDDALSWAEDRLLDNYLGIERYSKTIALKDFGMLRALTKDENEIISGYVERNSYNDGDKVFKQDEEADRIHLLAKGRAHIIIRLANGATLRVGTLSLGTVFGEMAVIDSKPRSATVIADGHIECYEFTVDSLSRMKKENPEIAFKFISGLSHELSKRIRISNRIVTELKA